MSSNKFEKYTKAFAGGLFVIASNDLPLFAREMNHAYHDTQWLPFEARCELVYLEGAKKGTMAFPYNECVLAKAIKHRVCQLTAEDQDEHD